MGFFVNPETGKPYWPGRLQEHHLVPAGKAAKIGRIGWHTFFQYSDSVTIPGVQRTERASTCD